ncbi:hypothetical protein ACFV1L_13960 [Kitasatospora sp. NPDC059646]|uniref:hypothetical protein n=1 Tax=Kitasatospora sp. NPDC059646 TaxID=3346893 RepID=UPI0036CD0ED5
MSARARLRRSAAVALVSAITAGSALLLTACDPDGTDSATGTTGSPAATASASSGSTAEPSEAAPSASRNGGTLNRTAGTGLTVSTGTSTVLMDGKSVDFGTVVRDLAWSPDGKHAAFIDGSGNLQTSDPDGSHKTVIAKAPAGVTWSHPTWQVTTPDQYDKGRTNIVFAADDKGVLRLLSVPAKAGATPAVLALNPYSDDNPKVPPATGNQWPGSTGAHGSIVYANKDDGQVYHRDDYLRQQGGVTTKGSQPAADDEGDLVFVRSVGGHDHIFERTNDDSHQERDLTPDAAVDYTEPVISHDGRTVAFRGPDGIYTVPTRGGKPERITDTVGLPAFRS